jgi:hypothetical protein
MERSFLDLPEDFFEYFKQNITRHYLDPSHEIRKTISNLINTFLRLGGVEMWPEILDFLLSSLNSALGAETALETLNFIIEDSGSHLEEKSYPFLLRFLQQLVFFLKRIQSSSPKLEVLNLVLNNIYVLLENCRNFMNEEIESVIEALLTLKNYNEVLTRYHIGRCWLSVIKIKKDILSSLLDQLFIFFMGNFTVDNYQTNFISAEFFSMLIQSEDKGKLNEANKVIQIDDLVFKKIGANLKE